MESKPFKSSDLTKVFADEEVMDRQLAYFLGQLAADLAAQAGEEVKRPLSRDQLARALRVNYEEMTHVRSLMAEHWAALHRRGALSEAAYWKDPRSEES